MRLISCLIEYMDTRKSQSSSYSSIVSFRIILPILLPILLPISVQLSDMSDISLNVILLGKKAEIEVHLYLKNTYFKIFKNFS